MSHEFRTPLNAIMGFSEAIKSEFLGPVGTATYREYAGDIHASGSRLLGIVDDILELAESADGEPKIIEEEVGLTDLAARAMALVQDQASAKGIHLEIDAPDNIVPIYTDRTKLNWVLVNLLSEMIGHMQRDASCCLALARDWCGGGIITITDNHSQADQDIRMGQQNEAHDSAPDPSSGRSIGRNAGDQQRCQSSDDHVGATPTIVAETTNSSIAPWH